MKILDWKRASGKTRELVKWVKFATWTNVTAPTRVILVPNLHNKRYVEELLDGEGLVLCVSELSRLRGLKNVEVVIDELDDFLRAVVGHPVIAVTRTGKKTNEY